MVHIAITVCTDCNCLSKKKMKENVYNYTNVIPLKLEWAAYI